MTDTDTPPPDTPKNAAGDFGVCLDALSLRIGDTLLFSHMSENFEAGQWTCILGPSGVGKSMLLRAILGLIDAPFYDDITVSGAVHASGGEALSGHASYMAQQDLLFPWLTLRENINLGDRLRRRNSSDAPDTPSLLKSVGLENHADKLPAKLSGGMRQRAALARTLKENRPIVIMDEPFSAVDAITRLRLQDMASEFLRGRTVLMVTHDPLEALRLGHKVLVLTGCPATFNAPITPVGLPPRSVESREILDMQGQLLTALQDHLA